MKNIPLILMLFALMASCQTKAKNIDNKTYKVMEIQPFTSPTITPAQTKAETSNSQTESTTKSNDINSRIGNVESGEQSVCLKIQNPSLKIGDKVQIILTEIPQEVLEAEISEKNACKNEDFGELSKEDLTYYSLKSSEEKFLSRGFGIGVVNSTQKAKLVKGLASIDLNNSGKEEYFRECTSNEGLHLTVWTGKPMVGKRIWHSYYHFNYDTQNDCKKKDYEGTDN